MAKSGKINEDDAPSTDKTLWKYGMVPASKENVAAVCVVKNPYKHSKDTWYTLIRKHAI